MVGKPNLPQEADLRDDLMGAAVPEPGLTALDQERAASLADEGGWAGARAETQQADAAATRAAWARRCSAYTLCAASALAFSLLLWRRRRA
jgi:hypothetical protein